MKIARWAWVIALLTLLTLVAAACSSGSKSSGPTTTTSRGGTIDAASSNSRHNVDGTLVVGKLLPQSGQMSAAFKALDTPINMAIDEINKAGGVNGKPIVVKAADDGTSADVATVSLDTLLEDKVDVIMGPASSGTARGILEKIKTGEVVTCSGSTSAPDLSDAAASTDGYFLRTAPPDKLQGPALAQLITNDGSSKVAILVRNDSYGTGFGDALEKALREQGVDVVMNAPYDFNAADFKTDVANVKATSPDAVVVIGFIDDGGKIIKEMIDQGLGPNKVHVYTADGMADSSFYKAVDPSNPTVVQAIKGTAPALVPSGVIHPFAAEYAKTGQSTTFAPYYYDCMMITALAAQAAGTDDPGRIRGKIRQVSSGGQKCQTYAECLGLMKQGKDIDYDGASGAVDLDKDNEPTVGVYDVWQFDAAGKPINIAGIAQIKIQG